MPIQIFDLWICELFSMKGTGDRGLNFEIHKILIPLKRIHSCSRTVVWFGSDEMSYKNSMVVTNN